MRQNTEKIKCVCELAQIFCHLCGWETFEKKAPEKCVSAYLEYKAAVRKEQELFYQTQQGLSRVYPHGEMDIMELNQILQKRYFRTRKRVQEINIRGRTYHLMINEELMNLNEYTY